MRGVFDDLRFALRTCRRAPLFTLVVVATIGAGIAACAVVFGVVNAVLFRPFDAMHAPPGLVYLFEQNRKQNATGPVSPASLVDWQRLAGAFDRMGGITPKTLTVVGGPEPESVFAGAVTEGFFRVIEPRPAAGRVFVSGDYAAGASPVALLAHSYWRGRFAASPSVVGRALTIDGHPVTVVGVLAPDCSLKPLFGVEPLAFVPWSARTEEERSARSLFVVARMKPGLKTRQARADIQAVAARLDAAAARPEGWSAALVNPREFDPAGDAQFLIVLAAALLCVLLVVSANVANLLLSRAAGRVREIATRLAIGAGRARIARQLLVESLVLGAAGSAGGVTAAFWVCRLLRWWLSTSAIGHLDIGLDRRVLLFSAAISVFVAVVAGLAPAIRLSRAPILAGLKEGTAMWSSLSPARLRTLLAATEVGFAVVLAVSAALVVQSTLHVRDTNPGFRAEGLFSVSVTLPEARYAEPETKIAFADAVLARYLARGDMESAAAATMLPAAGGEAPVEPFTVEGRPDTGDRLPAAGVVSVSAGYFKTMGIPIKAGRPFDGAGRGEGARVAVVSEALVRRWMGGGTPVGTRIQLGGKWLTIVGIAGDVRTFHLNVAPAPTVYLPYWQRPRPSMVFLIRARGGDSSALVAAAKAEIHGVDAEQPVRGGRAVEDAVAASLGGFELGTVIIAALAVVALALASLGIYGVLAYSVARRSREFGVRVALGASGGDIVRQVLAEGARVGLYGGVPGALAAAAIGGVLASRLQRVSPFDPLVLGGTLGLIGVIVVAASWLPARRAVTSDPARATRAE